MPIEIMTLAIGPFEANCYIVSDGGGGPAMIIDPGAEAERIIEEVRQAQLDVRLIVNTHGHGDHMGANRDVKAAFPKALLAIHEADLAALTDPHRNLSAAFGYRATSPPADLVLSGGAALDVGALQFEVIHVPGHSPGSICLGRHATDEEGPVMFTGDVLFAGTIGRSDFPGGDMEALVAGIRDLILTWPDETVIYPGHGGPTTVGDERAQNPHLAVSPTTFLDPDEEDEKEERDEDEVQDKF